MRTRWLGIGVVIFMLGALPAAAAGRPGQAFGLGAPGPAAKAAPAGIGTTYIVQLAGEPVATYQGGTAGLAATSPLATGASKLDPRSAASIAYADYLEAAQDRFVDAAGAAVGRHLEALHHYRFAINGVALIIDSSEADVVATLPGVEAVTLSQSQPLLTDVGPRWIGAPGVWDGSALGGEARSMGEGVVVGVVDTGINMDHPSFAAVGGDGYAHSNPLGPGNYLGWCDPAHPLHDPARHVCNDKLIGAWSFPESGNEPEDADGHGSHTASTIAGNVLSSTLVAPTVTITRPISGVAPHANIIAYDACGGDCPDSATTAAIDQAVADGVDVINYSIGTSRTGIWSDDNPVMTAFRNARAAGVISSVSAGNAGPGPLTTAAVGPWMTSVGAATHNRVMENALVNLTGGDTAPPADIIGKGMTAGYGPAPIVYAQGFLKADGTADDGQCLTAFPAGTFNGEIVVCDRGDIPRTQKGQNVKAGGAGGLILANAAANGASTNADGHYLPAVHITYADGQVLKAWLASGQGHTGTISGTRFNLDPANGDITAGFSSRGPTRWGACCLRPGTGFYARRWLNILKPDVTGPGVDVWAAYGTDSSNPSPAPEFAFLSGTSMSSPHLTGASALMRGVHPDWTPAEVQSALMTTAITNGVRKEDGVTPADWFDMGAGRVDVGRAAAAGFVLDMTMDEAMAVDPEAGGDPATLNLASMANFSCLARCGWTRTVTSTLDAPVQWLLSTSASAGMTLTVAPGVFTLAPGASQTITVTADVTAVTPDTFAFGRIDFEPEAAELVTQHVEGVPLAHMPVAVRAATAQLPLSVVSELPPVVVALAPLAAGSWAISGLRSTAAPSLTLAVAGLVPATTEDVALEQDPSNGNPYNGDGGTVMSTLAVPDGARRIVAEVDASEAPDIDLFVGRDDNGDGAAEAGELRCRSTSGSWREYCDVRDPEAGTWWVLVQNWRASAEAPDDVTYRYGAVGPEDEDNLTAAGPDSVALAQAYDVDLAWSLDDEIQVGDVWYGLLDLGSTASSGGDIVSLGVDVVGAEPSRIFLPSLHDGEGPPPARGRPGDPAGFIIDRAGDDPNPAPNVPVTLFHAPGLQPDAMGPLSGNCRTIHTNGGDWGMVPSVVHEPGEYPISSTMLSPVKGGPPPAAMNPDLSNTNGAYGWFIDSSLLPGCFFVEVDGPTTGVSRSPLVGVTGQPADDVTDLNHCLVTGGWGSNPSTVCP